MAAVPAAGHLAAIRAQSNPAAVLMLEGAQKLQPQDKFIASLREQMRKYEASRQRVSMAPRPEKNRR